MAIKSGLSAIEAQLDGWRRLMDPESPDFDPAFRPSLGAIEAAQDIALGALESLEEPIDDPEWEDRDDAYRPGCGEYDTVDSKGRPLKPRVNEAGEPWWM